jgi:SAM-dependent methyltransferase
LYLLQRGCSYLALQDYNSEVIETATIDNARLNARPYSSAAVQASPASASASAAAAAAPMSPEELDRRVGFFSGDWSDPALLGMMGRGSYDLILTSDTLYSVAYMLPLFRACAALLAPGGSALVAAKRYYFGIGGSTMEFADLVKREGRGEWSCTLVDTIEDGKSNIREILLLKRTPQAEAAARAAAAAAANSQMQ